MGFGRRRPPANQQGPGSQGQPSPALQYGERRAGAKRACAAFLSQGALGLSLVFRGELHSRECSSQKLVLGPLWDGASALCGRAGSRGMAGVWAKKAFARQSYLLTKENPFGVGFRRRRAPAKHQGPGSQGQPGPALPYGERRARGENSLRCFHEPRQVGDVVCCWKSFPLQNAAPRSSFWAVSRTGPRR